MPRSPLRIGAKDLLTGSDEDVKATGLLHDSHRTDDRHDDPHDLPRNAGGRINLASQQTEDDDACAACQPNSQPTDLGTKEDECQDDDKLSQKCQQGHSWPSAASGLVSASVFTGSSLSPGS